jgi:hypothetical protein
MADRRLRFVLPTRVPGKKITAKRVVAGVAAAPLALVLLVAAVHWWRTNEGPADKLRNGIITELTSLESTPPFTMELPVTDDHVAVTTRCDFFEGGEPRVDRSFSFDPAARETIGRRLEAAMAEDGWHAGQAPARGWTRSSGPYALRASLFFDEDSGTLHADVSSHQYC